MTNDQISPPAKDRLALLQKSAFALLKILRIKACERHGFFIRRETFKRWLAQHGADNLFMPAVNERSHTGDLFCQFENFFLKFFSGNQSGDESHAQRLFTV